jgi:hypothetical protein
MSVSVAGVSGADTCTATVTWQEQAGTGVFEPQGTVTGGTTTATCTPTIGAIQPSDATLTVDCTQEPPTFRLAGGASPTQWPVTCPGNIMTIATCAWLPPAIESGPVANGGVMAGDGGPVTETCVGTKGSVECTFTNSFSFAPSTP